MEAKRHIEPHQATFLMVGCKKDLARTEREVPKETAQVIKRSMCVKIQLKEFGVYPNHMCETRKKNKLFRPWQITMEFLSWRLRPKLERMLRRLSPLSARPSMTRLL